MTDTDLIAEARKVVEGWTPKSAPHSPAGIIDRLRIALESRNAEVSALREVIEKVRVARNKYTNGLLLYDAISVILRDVPAVASPETKNEGDTK